MQHLEALIGNAAAIGYLRHMMQANRVHHTLLFHGPQGVGKTTAALAFARDLGIKPSDIREFLPEGKAHIHTIDSMGEVKKAAIEHPYESIKKLLLIRDADRMLPSGANALLKTLEEPLESTLIILTTSHLEGILETIQSRASLVAFRSLSLAEIQKILESRGIDPLQAEKAALIAQGNITRALAYESEQKIEALVFEALEKLLIGNVIGSMDTFGLLEDADSEHIFTLILQYFRDLHLIKIGASDTLLFNKNERERLQKLISCPIPELERVHSVIKEGYVSLKHNMRLRSILEGMVVSFIADNSLVTRN